MPAAPSSAARLSFRRQNRDPYVEAVMDISPWDCWKPGGHEAKPQSVPIVPTLERVLARNPHPAGAIHLYIHAVEA